MKDEASRAPAGLRTALTPSVQTLCALCETRDYDREVYRARLPEDAASHERFSARRAPDRVHYRMVRCERCGLLRSDPVYSDADLANLYADSWMTYGEQEVFAADTYEQELRSALQQAPGRGRLLEIGCGSGFFLERALRLGFAEVRGIEPSRNAVEQAADVVRGSIVTGVFEESLFDAASFDAVCAFQVFDHLPRPNETLRACRNLLKPGGLALFVNHDARAWTNRLLRERSPIIDVEHVFLYDRVTMRRIFEKNGFEVLRVHAVKNRYPLAYWCKMAPLGGTWKEVAVPWLRQSPLGRIPVSLRAGNLGLVARRAE